MARDAPESAAVFDALGAAKSEPRIPEVAAIRPRAEGAAPGNFALTTDDTGDWAPREKGS